MKDNFSTQSDDYARFRPQYPKELIDYLLALVPEKIACWDCGTGNGQLAAQLSPYFEKIYATDISKRQLGNATKMANIEFSLQPAEETSFPNQSFDLITVAQAAHWFDFEKFNPEVKRLLKPQGVIALFGYGLVQVEGVAGEIVHQFYWNITKPYWDPERNHIEARYETIPFPFSEFAKPHIDIQEERSLKELLGYIGTWSAVQHFKRDKGYSPIDQLRNDLLEVWPTGKRVVTFPMFYRIGKGS